MTKRTITFFIPAETELICTAHNHKQIACLDGTDVIAMRGVCVCVRVGCLSLRGEYHATDRLLSQSTSRSLSHSTEYIAMSIASCSNAGRAGKDTARSASSFPRSFSCVNNREQSVLLLIHVVD
jgi:hypothetical protein